MELQFTKMHGAGNDYVYVDCFKYKIDEPEKLSVIVSDRHKGIGADGLILVAPSDTCDVRMIMYNADGSRGKMCGNGSRCVAKFAYDRGYVKNKELTLETDAGVKYITLHTGEDGKAHSATVNMGKSVTEASKVPVITDKKELVLEKVSIGGREVEITCVSMGNPHCVVFTDENVKDIDLEKIGPVFENAPIFPERVNTEFVNVISSTELDMRVWERGSGETFACGTGACATAVAAIMAGHCKKNTDITVHMKGGDLVLRQTDDDVVFMTGEAVEVFNGNMKVV